MFTWYVYVRWFGCRLRWGACCRCTKRSCVWMTCWYVAAFALGSALSICLTAMVDNNAKLCKQPSPESAISFYILRRTLRGTSCSAPAAGASEDRTEPQQIAVIDLKIQIRNVDCLICVILFADSGDRMERQHNCSYEYCRMVLWILPHRNHRSGLLHSSRTPTSPARRGGQPRRVTSTENVGSRYRYAWGASSIQKRKGYCLNLA